MWTMPRAGARIARSTTPCGGRAPAAFPPRPWCRCSRRSGERAAPARRLTTAAEPGGTAYDAGPLGGAATPTCSRCCAHTMPAAKCPGGGTVTLYDVRRHVDELTRPGVDQRHADRVLRCGLPPHVEVA